MNDIKEQFLDRDLEEVLCGDSHSPNLVSSIFQAAETAEISEKVSAGDAMSGSQAHAHNFRRRFSIYAAAASVVVGIGLMFMGEFYEVPSKDDVAVNAPVPDPTGITFAHAQWTQDETTKVVKMTEGWALVKRDAPTLSVGESEIEIVEGEVLVKVGEKPTQAEIESIQNTYGEKEMILNSGKWVAVAGMAVCVLSGSVLIDDEVLFAQDAPAVQTEEEFYKNGSLKSHLEFYWDDNNGKEASKRMKHGKQMSWFANGQPSAKMFYDRGRPVGEWSEWWENGQLKIVANYVDGKRHGELSSWYEDGKKNSECFFDQGKNVGQWSEWWEGGQLKTVVNYVGGERHGELSSWYADGQKKEEHFYDQGKKSGTCSGWWEDGTLRGLLNYADGKRHGEWVGWYANGQKESEAFYDSDKLNGQSSEWWKTGELKSTLIFVGGKRHGELSEWYVNGQKKCEGFYEAGKQTGTWTTWDEKGNVTATKSYDKK